MGCGGGAMTAPLVAAKHRPECHHCSDQVSDVCKFCGRRWTGPNKELREGGPVAVDTMMATRVGFRLSTHAAWGDDT